jgi:hypothetical protein
MDRSRQDKLSIATQPTALRSRLHQNNTDIGRTIMNAFRQIGRKLFSSTSSLPRVVNRSGFVLLDPALNIEEERMPAYDKGLYYPVRLGDVYSSR